MDYQSFWQYDSFAVVGDSARKKFPVLTFARLRRLGKQVYAVDPTAGEIEGQGAYPDFASQPQRVEAAVLETPPEDTAAWVEKAAAAGIGNIWIHQRCETPAALDLARELGLDVYHGTCAVMYLSRGFSAHALHGFINKLLGRY